MKALFALLLLCAGFAASAAASDYTLENRAIVAFPSPHGDTLRVSPYPMSKRAASVWKSDGCWRECTMRFCAWKMDTCVNTIGSEACRPRLDACDRACQRECRTSGGPLPGFIDW